MQSVVSEWQVVGEDKSGLTHEPPVDLLWRFPVLRLSDIAPGSAGLEVDPHLGRAAVRDVYPERQLPSRPGNDAWWEHPRPPVSTGIR